MIRRGGVTAPKPTGPDGPVYLTRREETMSVQIGRKAPEFAATAVVAGEFKQVSLADFKGKWVVMFFYPLDFTFV
jgi:hypothetical protein